MSHEADRAVIGAKMTQISELVIYAVRSILELRVFELSSIMNASQGFFISKL